MFGLGELEGAVMNVLWQLDAPAKVRNVLEDLGPRRKLAYTTVMTVLDNLHRKGWVNRQRVGRAYEYWPVFGREEAAARALRETLASSGNPEGALMHFFASASDHEADILRNALARKADGR